MLHFFMEITTTDLQIKSLTKTLNGNVSRSTYSGWNINSLTNPIHKKIQDSELLSMVLMVLIYALLIVN